MCVTLLSWALHIVIKQQFFYIYAAYKAMVPELIAIWQSTCR